MNNRGFTLIELLAVIVILTGISLIAVVNITSSLARRDDKECQEQIELAKNAAKVYFSLNDTANTVTIGTLKSEGFFNENSKLDKLENNDSVASPNNSYAFTGTGSCKES